MSGEQDLVKVEGVTSDPARLTGQEIASLAVKARKGDRKAAQTLRRHFDANPTALIELGRGDVGVMAEDLAIREWVGDEADANQLMRVAMQAKADTLRTELAGAAPSPLERLLVDRIVLCWLRVNELEVISSGGGMTASAKDRVIRRLNSAHARYLGAIKALAIIRKASAPRVQINTAEQMVVGDVAPVVGRSQGNGAGSAAPALPPAGE